MLTIQKSCAQFWVDKLGFTLQQTMPGLDGAKIFVLSPTPEAETAIVLLDKEAVAAYSPELVLATPSLMFHCDDVALKREELLKAGVHVGANRKKLWLVIFVIPRDIISLFLSKQKSDHLKSSRLGDYEKESLLGLSIV